MALIGGGYPDSFGGESYPRRRAAPEAPAPVTPAPAPTQNTQAPDTPAPAPAPAPKYALDAGFDQTKLADPTHNSFKYQFGRLAQNYDPRQGITSGLLDDLNKLGYAQFSGGGQKLSIKGVTDAGRAAGLDPYDFTGDFIRGFGGSNPQWGYDWWTPPQQSGAPQGGFGDLSSVFAAMFQPQPPPQQAPSFHITQSGLDPQVLSQLLSMVNQPQAPQQVVVPGYQPSAPQTQAPPMVPQAGPTYGGQSVQTQGPAAAAPGGVDPFMAWLRQQVMQGGPAL